MHLAIPYAYWKIIKPLLFRSIKVFNAWSKQKINTLNTSFLHRNIIFNHQTELKKSILSDINLWVKASIISVANSIYFGLQKRKRIRLLDTQLKFVFVLQINVYRLYKIIEKNVQRAYQNMHRERAIVLSRISVINPPTSYTRWTVPGEAANIGSCNLRTILLLSELKL